MDLTILVFLHVYLAMGLGHLPGLKVDRTGAAVVGALVLIAAGRITADAAWRAIDYRTIGLLFGLMVVSAAFVVSGFYTWAAAQVASRDAAPPVLLALLVVVGGALSAVLTNDVVVVAMTPLLVSITLARGLNPTPFLLGFCFAANAVSSGTLIGSPQNMIAAETLHISFTGFLRLALAPAVLSMPIVWGIVALLYRGRWRLAGTPPTGPSAAATPAPNKRETIKAAVVALAVVLAFIFSDWQRDLIALGAAAVLLVNRQVASGDLLKNVDGNLILLLMGLFVVNAALAATGLPQRLLSDLRALGLDLSEPLPLYAAIAVLSNIVGNNPAVMLLAPFLDRGADADALGAAIALGTGFSSNLVVFGSLAGIIVVEQAARHGVKITFGEFCRAGVPVSLACLALGAAWILLLAG